MTPKHIIVDLDGLYGYGIVKVPFEERKAGNTYITSFCFDGAQYGIAVFHGKSKEEATKKMERFVKENKINSSKIYTRNEVAHFKAAY